MPGRPCASGEVLSTDVELSCRRGMQNGGQARNKFQSPATSL